MKRRTRRWGRILFNTLTAISLLLAIATAGLWVRSGFVRDAFIRTNQWPVKHSVMLDWFSGILQVEVYPPSTLEFFGEFDDSYGEHPLLTPAFSIELLTRHAFGFDFYPWDDAPSGIGHWTIRFPFWFPLIAFAVFPIAWALIYRSRHRVRPGLCPACGYDTRANLAKCSECGLEIVSRES